jgi:sugar fermentation stimulation protein A
MLYVVQRDDCARMRLAADIDPAYAAAFRAAAEAGVEAVAYATAISPRGVTLGPEIPFAPPVP